MTYRIALESAMLPKLANTNAQFVLSPGEACGQRIKKRVITLKPWTKIQSVVAQGLSVSNAHPRNANRAAGTSNSSGFADNNICGGSKKAGMN
jgi:hypothetical protein